MLFDTLSNLLGQFENFALSKLNLMTLDCK